MVPEETGLSNIAIAVQSASSAAQFFNLILFGSFFIVIAY